MKPAVCGWRPLGCFSRREIVCSKSKQVSKTEHVKPAVGCILWTRPPCVPAGDGCCVTVAVRPALRAGSSSHRIPNPEPPARGYEPLGLCDGRLVPPVACLPAAPSPAPPPVFWAHRSVAYTCSVTRQSTSLCHLLPPSGPHPPSGPICLLSQTLVALWAPLPFCRFFQK